MRFQSFLEEIPFFDRLGIDRWESCRCLTSKVATLNCQGLRGFSLQQIPTLEFEGFKVSVFFCKDALKIGDLPIPTFFSHQKVESHHQKSPNKNYSYMSFKTLAIGARYWGKAILWGFFFDEMRRWFPAPHVWWECLLPQTLAHQSLMEESAVLKIGVKTLGNRTPLGVVYFFLLIESSNSGVKSFLWHTQRLLQTSHCYGFIFPFPSKLMA